MKENGIHGNESGRTGDPIRAIALFLVCSGLLNLSYANEPKSIVPVSSLHSPQNGENKTNKREPEKIVLPNYDPASPVFQIPHQPVTLYRRL